MRAPQRSCSAARSSGFSTCATSKAASERLLLLAGCPALCGGLRVDEVVEAVFGDAEPEVLVFAEGAPRAVDLLELRALLGQLVVELERRLVAGLHHRARKRA